MANPAPDQSDCPISADIIIIGGGFGGCYALHQLRKLGYTVKLLEAGSDLGGVSHFNRYPGARVDSEVPLYQLNLPAVWQSFSFRERFPGHVELREYFAVMTKTLDLHKDAVLNFRVAEAKYNNYSNRWTLTTQDGRTADSKYAVFATGTTNKAYIPNFPGLEKYKGEVIHPAAWPAGIDVRNKKVGIIGQGASGLQILQELAKEDESQVTVFVRNPPTALPMKQRALTAQEAEELKNVYDALFHRAKYTDESGYAYNTRAQSLYEATPQERLRWYEGLWARGSYAIFTSNYPEHSWNKEANAELYRFWAGKVRARITDPVKREIMAPLEQCQWIGTKRPNLEMDYYEMLDRPNVRLVDSKRNSISEFSDSGIVVACSDGDQRIDLDLVIVATGYDSVTGSLYDMNVTNTEGVTLQEKWKGGVQTYLGMLVPELPNAFILYGPQAPSGLANGPPFLELQVEWIVEFLTKLKNEGASTFEVKGECAADYSQANLDAYAQSLMKQTPSWWNGSNIPGKVNEPLFWVKGLQSWRRETCKALEDLSWFIVD
ncbi:hypothetical protein BJX62DRAFT_228357 [Aspergillus germanicus]